MLAGSVTIAPEMEWRIIQEFPDYAIREDGVIQRITANRRGLFKGIIIKSKPYDKYGHRQVCLTKPDKGKQWKTVHQLVAMAFIGHPPSSKHEVTHWDGVAGNNHRNNLRWATRKENHADMYRHGTDRRGERNGRAKLTFAQVDVMKQELAEGCTLKTVAQRNGVGISTVHRIRRGINWNK